MSLARLRSESVAASAIAYASVTEQVALEVAHLEGDLTPVIAVGLRGSELHAIIGIGGLPRAFWPQPL